MELRCYPGALLFSKTARERQFWRKDLAPGSRGAGLGNMPGPSAKERPRAGAGASKGACVPHPKVMNGCLTAPCAVKQPNDPIRISRGLIFSKLGPHPCLESPLEMSLI